MPAPPPPSPAAVLGRIEEALRAAVSAFARFQSGAIASEDKAGGRGPVTEADRAVDELLARMLPRGDEGWLSEETKDDQVRLGKRRVWSVDPLDGTKEFVHGIPEWCVSIGFIEDGWPVAGGIANPATGEMFLGAVGVGVTYNGRPAGVSTRAALDGAVVLASRSELDRGDWQRYAGAPFLVKPMGSVAYKLALVAAGLADATWTLAPKHEWDVAAGVALVLAGGGRVRTLDGTPLQFNQRRPWLSGLAAYPESLEAALAPSLLPPGGLESRA